MHVKVKILLDNNYTYKMHLRYNSYWYKILNRNPDMINEFIKEVKETYKLRTTDKLNDVMDKINMVSKFIDVLR